MQAARPAARSRQAGSRSRAAAGAGRCAAGSVQRGFRWGAMFWSALGGLVTLGSGLASPADRGPVRAQRESRLSRAGFAIAAALAIVRRRTRALGLARLATIEKLHLRASAVLAATIAPKPRNRPGPAGDWRTRTRNWRGRAPHAGPCR
jgi:hypothetical protein